MKITPLEDLSHIAALGASIEAMALGAFPSWSVGPWRFIPREYLRPHWAEGDEPASVSLDRGEGGAKWR